MSIGNEHYQVLSLLLLIIGMAGVLLRRNVIIMLISVELILNAVNLSLLAAGDRWGQLQGQVFAMFVIAVAVAEAAVGLSILIALFRLRRTLQADELDLLKW
jgi:NADH-quinone oxidoreductase subunit K